MKDVEKTGFCRFCNQAKVVKVPADMLEEDVDETVTLQCTCRNALDYKYEKEREETKQIFIENTFSDILQDFVKEAIAFVENEDLTSCSIKIGEWTYKISKNASDRLVISAKQSHDGEGLKV